MREQHQTDLESLKDKSQKRVESLFAEIEKLLPGATSSGLASAYKEAKETHEKIVVRWEVIFAIIVAALVIFPSAILIPKLGEIFSQNTVNFEMLVGRLLVLLPIELPLFWIGFKAIRVANQHRRISEEYRHKWAVASSFWECGSRSRKLPMMMTIACLKNYFRIQFYLMPKIQVILLLMLKTTTILFYAYSVNQDLNHLLKQLESPKAKSLRIQPYGFAMLLAILLL